MDASALLKRAPLACSVISLHIDIGTYVDSAVNMNTITQSALHFGVSGASTAKAFCLLFSKVSNVILLISEVPHKSLCGPAALHQQAKKPEFAASVCSCIYMVDESTRLTLQLTVTTG